MDEDIKRQLRLLNQKKAQLQAQPYGPNTDELVKTQREIDRLSPQEKPKYSVPYVPEQPEEIERIDKEEAKKFRKGLERGPDYEEGFKNIKTLLGLD